MAQSFENRIDTLEQATNMATRSSRSRAEQLSALDKTFLWAWLNWETVAWVLILALAVVTRIYDLGTRAMHHDESIHAKWSFDLFRGRSAYQYDPTYHGPMIYYATALSFMLLGGDNENTARMGAAIFGIGLVGLCWYLRPLIGKYGALFAGALVLISPTILYYSRSLRHDIFATFGEMLFIVGFFRFIQQKERAKIRWLGFAGLGLGIAWSSHELIILTLGILGTWLALAFIFEIVTLSPGARQRIPGRLIKRKPAPPVRNNEELDTPEEETPPEPTTVVEEEPEEERELKPWPWRLLVFNENGLYGAGAAFLAVMLVAALVSLRFAFAARDYVKYPGNGLPKGSLFIIGPEVDKWLAWVVNAIPVALVIGIIVGWLVTLADITPDSDFRGTAVLRGLVRIARQPKAIALFIGMFALVYVPLFSNFLTYTNGLADGLYKGIEYWLSVQGTRRLDQPWFYYPMLMLLYEPLAFFLGLVALVMLPVIWWRRSMRRGAFRFTVRGLMMGFCFWWSVLAMTGYSLAGEKAPWLNMQITLPAILSASFLVEYAVRRVDWRTLRKPTQGWLFGTLFILLFAVVGVLLGMLIGAPEAGQTTILTNGTPLSNDETRLYMLLESLIILIVGIGLAAAAVWLWRSGRIEGRIMRATIAVIVMGALFAYGVKSTVNLNYYHPDTPVEPMIYVQTAPDVPLFVQRVERLARDVRDSYRIIPPAPNTTNPVPVDPGGTNGLPILISNEVSWPLVWYFRNYSDVNFFTPNNNGDVAIDAVPLKDARGNPYAVIAIQTAEDQPKLQAQLKNQYTRYQIRFRWWFPQYSNGYGGLGVAPPGSTNTDLDSKKIQNTDWGKLWRTFTTQPSAGQMWRYIMYRQVDTPLESYDMVYYVRNELEPDLSGVTSDNPAATGLPEVSYNLTESNQSGLKNGQYKTPRTVAIAPNGDILVLDSGNGRVQRFASDGKFLSKFGKIGTLDGLFNTIQNDGGPGGLAVDDEGNIYVADSWNYRIQKFDPTGKLITKWGQGFDTKGDPQLAKDNPTGLYGPRGIAFDRTKGELYVADTGNRRILVFDKTGKPLRQWGSKGSGPGQFDEPVDVAVSPDGRVFVTDTRNLRIQIFDRNGTYISEIPVPEWKEQSLSEPYLAFDKDGNLFVSDSANARIYKYDLNGKRVQTYDNNSGVVLLNPIGLAVGQDGFLYVADAKQNAIVKIKI